MLTYFFSSKEEYDKADKILEKNTVISDTDRAKMYLYNKKKIHIIKSFFYESPKKTVDDFDFTVCCAAISKSDVIYHDTFFVDLARRKLVINNLRLPINTLKRIQKYQRKGFYICDGGLLQIVKAVQTVDLEDKEINNIEYYSDGTVRFLPID
ncbi:MAG: hypothetical protein ACOC1K_02820 [Nanoarchaeota archaeon]